MKVMTFQIIVLSGRRKGAIGIKKSLEQSLPTPNVIELIKVNMQFFIGLGSFRQVMNSSGPQPGEEKNWKNCPRKSPFQGKTHFSDETVTTFKKAVA
jgi:hypothetical protein